MSFKKKKNRSKESQGNGIRENTGIGGLKDEG